jgi:PAS domain-containing protein
VPQVELELSGPYHSAVSLPAGQEPTGALTRWATAVDAADEACLLLDAQGVVVTLSAGFTQLSGVTRAGAVGRRLTDRVLHLLDFTADNAALPDWEVGKIPPLLAIGSKTLARGLLRIGDRQGAMTTVDAIATPVTEAGSVVGSLTFFAPVQR